MTVCVCVCMCVWICFPVCGWVGVSVGCHTYFFGQTFVFFCHQVSIAISKSLSFSITKFPHLSLISFLTESLTLNDVSCLPRLPLLKFTAPDTLISSVHPHAAHLATHPNLPNELVSILSRSYVRPTLLHVGFGQTSAAPSVSVFVLWYE